MNTKRIQTDQNELSYLRKQVSRNKFVNLDSRFRGNDKLGCVKERPTSLSKRKIFFFTLISIIGVCWLLSITIAKNIDSERLHFIDANSIDLQQSSHKFLVVVTHGWIEKGKGDWPEDMAVAIHQKADPNLWLCGYFDWQKGARTINPKDAAEYARDTAGEKLAEKIININGDLKHIHLIGHSSGCWTVSEAAKVLAKKTKADIHLTFLDAYVPYKWQEGLLGDVNMPADANFWADHYYTKDYTLSLTAQDLTNAHNVDISSIDQMINDHKFPWKWYYATITGKFPKWSLMNNRKLVTATDTTEYGFARSKEASEDNGWAKSLRLKAGNKAIKLKKQPKAKKHRKAEIPRS